MNILTIGVFAPPYMSLSTFHCKLRYIDTNVKVPMDVGQAFRGNHNGKGPQSIAD